MRRYWILCIALLAGCDQMPQYLYPLYTRDDLVFSEDLLGSWQSGDRETWTFEKKTDKSYTFRVRTEQEVRHYTAHLARIDTALFLDFAPVEDKGAQEGFWIPAHSFMRVRHLEPAGSLRLGLLGFDMDERLQENPALLEHRRPDDRLVITAPTRELQAFFSTYREEADLYIELDRVSGVTTPSEQY